MSRKKAVRSESLVGSRWLQENCDLNFNDLEKIAFSRSKIPVPAITDRCSQLIYLPHTSVLFV